MKTKPPKSKREQIIFVALCAAIAIVVVWYTLIDPTRKRLVAKRIEQSDAAAALEKLRAAVSGASRAKDSIRRAKEKVQTMEGKMAAGDPFRWLVNAFLDFPASTNVTIANFEPPHVSETILLPKVPYKTATFTLTGTGYYHEFGKFLAALENDFPHMRVRKLDLSPAYAGEASAVEAEKLNFEMELSMLVKPAPAQPAQLSQAPADKKPN